jgi:TonB family protein
MKLLTKITCGLALGMCLLMSSTVGLHGQTSSSSEASGWTWEIVLRQFAINSVRPEYPEDSLREKRTGVAVVKVYLGPDGHVNGVEVLEAPTPSIASSVSRAAAQWQFKPFDSDGKKYSVWGKLTFYFEIKKGKGYVLDPADAGYVGRWPQPSPIHNHS